MPIDPDTLSTIARDYAQGMASIRGRRVRRLLEREFAGAECVVAAELADGRQAVLGLSESGAAMCATDGTGPHAPVVKWLHGSDTAFESQYDLQKDSLPVLCSTTRPIHQLSAQWRLRILKPPLTERAAALLTRVLAVFD